MRVTIASSLRFHYHPVLHRLATAAGGAIRLWCAQARCSRWARWIS